MERLNETLWQAGHCARFLVWAALRRMSDAVLDFGTSRRRRHA